MEQKSQKQLQSSEQIKRSVAKIFLEDSQLQIPDVYITITQADISPDMKNCEIFTSITGKIDKKQKIKLIKELNGASNYIKGKLTTENRNRYTPKLHFTLDETGENASKISKLIDSESHK